MAELGLTRGAAKENVGEGLVDEERTSLGEDSEEIERGQEMDRRIGPRRVGEAEGAGLVLSDFTGCFQSIRPVNAKKRETSGSGNVV